MYRSFLLLIVYRFMKKYDLGKGVKMSVVILNKEQVMQTINLSEVIDGVRNVYKLKSEGKTVIWPLVNYAFVPEKAAMDIRSGYIMGEQLHGMKLLNNFPLNREKGLPPFNGLMLVYDSNTGIPVGLMDASYITCMRTGAAGALGAKLLARKDAKNLMLMGAGKQAPFQIAATLLLMPQIEKVFITDPIDQKNAQAFAGSIKAQLKDEFQIDASNVVFEAPETIEAAVKQSDIIITITPSRDSIIRKEWVKPGTHFSCIGSDMEGKEEIDEAIFAGARVYADDIPQCVRVGEMEIPIAHGIICKEDIIGEIGDLIAGKIEGRKNDQETTIFDATGLYILDLIVAKSVIARAKSEHIGLEIEM